MGAKKMITSTNPCKWLQEISPKPHAESQLSAVCTCHILVDFAALPCFGQEIVTTTAAVRFIQNKALVFGTPNETKILVV